jgi:hypothetical protein
VLVRAAARATVPFAPSARAPASAGRACARVLEGQLATRE